MEKARPQLSTIPPELIYRIISHTPKSTQLIARLLSKTFYAPATSEAFKHVRLNETNARQFQRIASTPGLRYHVRQITCDARDGIVLNNGPPDVYRPGGFLAALPSIRLFTNLRALNLVFRRYLDAFTPNGRKYITEDSDTMYFFRKWVLFAAFHCIVGRQVVPSDCFLITLPPPLIKTLLYLGIQDPDHWDFLKECRSSIPLEELSITNLCEMGTTQGERSDAAAEEHWWAFREVASLPSFKKLKLMVTPNRVEPREDDEWQEPAVYSTRDRFALVLKVLPEWFTPSAARNLTVLSLHHDELWGYAPKFDFRTIGAAPDPGLPQLRTLSLSRFCFSHEWQIDWIASLGKGDLKELYLDDCVLLSVAYCTIAPGEATTEPTCVEDVDGNKIQLSNHGYLPDSWQGGNSWDQWLVYYRSNIQWHQFFNHWRKSMSSLMVFRMGSSEAHKTWSHVNLSDYWLDPLPRTTIPLGAHFIFLKENAHNMFHDDAWRGNARIAELRVPFYVKYMPEPLDSDNRDLRPWTFLPPMKHEAKGSKQADEEDKKQEDDDVMALSMLRHEVQNRSMGWTS
ncbi:hypothetical protein CGCSCA4_v006430 [Colletotrichum siamense]|uniref:F-box domain-containing protein n=1 Tax=Colletotrichum siamense TaxID=690259 RepID=A0A9P5EGJ9_COLSI|nr:hypothetical protein CGCSCA4_v006430 [Colletotrichum siamense]KAF4852147.1 hypothetical protein CGCSCA2_v010671 [Colletotrichum siamense]